MKHRHGVYVKLRMSFAIFMYKLYHNKQTVKETQSSSLVQCSAGFESISEHNLEQDANDMPMNCS